MLAQTGRFFDGTTVIRSNNRRAGLSSNSAVSPPSTTGIQNSKPLEFLKPYAGFCLKSGLVLLVVCDFVPIPLQPETGQMFLSNKTRDTGNNRVLLSTGFARQGVFGVVEYETLSTTRTNKLIEKFRVQGSIVPNAVGARGG